MRKRQSIPSTDLVPGDIILVEEGDTVPADARLIQITALQTAEAALTGQSLPVPKDAAPIGEETGLGDLHNMIFNGTSVTYGRSIPNHRPYSINHDAKELNRRAEPPRQSWRRRRF